MVVTEVVEDMVDNMVTRREEKYGGDRGCGGHGGQHGDTERKNMVVTEVVEDMVDNMVTWREEKYGGDRGCGGHGGQHGDTERGKIWR